jgi:hypothetical protein
MPAQLFPYGNKTNSMKKPEQWKDIIEFTGYQISNWGRVKSLERTKVMPTGGIHHIAEKIMSLKSVKGYNCVKLCLNGRHYTKRVARLVGIHFVPNKMDFPIINHIDTDKTNDYFENLEWTDESGNMKHAFQHGLMKMPWQGKLHSNGKFYPITAKKVI